MISRHIPSDVSKDVRERHFFECAWCGERLTEKHHIVEFSRGGPHNVENLILLCPNCHTQVHGGEIKTEELEKRKSNHTKGDRIAGGVQFDLKEPIINIGNAQFIHVPILLQFREEPLIELEEKDGEYLLSTRFYNRTGELIFWMSSNRYWTNSSFTIISKREELLIVNNDLEGNKIRIWQNNSTLNIEGANYLNGMALNFNPKFMQIGNSVFYGLSSAYCSVGILIQ
ncbi:MAG: HNH endonuclease signature motif containing protein [Bacteroidales bacterium]|jgi:hypothetical protein